MDVVARRPAGSPSTGRFTALQARSRGGGVLLVAARGPALVVNGRMPSIRANPKD